MNTPALLIVIFVVLYNFQHAAAILSLATIMQGKYNSFTVRYTTPLLYNLIGLGAALAANTYL